MNRRTSFGTAVIALATAAGLAVAGLSVPASAQNADNQQSEPSSEQQQAPSYSEAKLESFAAAAVEVSSVMQEYRPQLREAQQNEDREQFEKLRMQAKNAMDEKIAATDGITTGEYQEIAKAAQQDKQLRQKVLGLMQAQQKQEQGQ
ncbi:DUF4168 domain-containing protein [Rhodovibrio salinarum]|uniref:DUF4168 domain-containing protein n=1 Tax=Rhodovibrio salinarum TaxID=1087 RepID=A0A934QIJ2_9PROT|nr:DUF4168 domain-containing protein [Rhodovibrio salinarum]MBK1697417.1 DUF4168 domain-containing protein [Rhodovibrio salinarum]